MMLTQVAKRLEERDVYLHWDAEVASHLAQEGYDPKFGARPLRRLIQRTVEDMLSEELILGHFALGDHVQLYLEDGTIKVRKKQA